jgi:adenylate kinase family enzyme
MESDAAPPLIMQVQRSDDTEDKVRNRLRTYHANVDAVVGYYKECLVEVSWGWGAVLNKSRSGF